MAKPHDYQQVYFSSKSERTAIYKRENLQAGIKLISPCIVTEYSATTLIPRSAFASVDEFENLIVQID
jgi:N-methylhydantoinase A